MIPDRSRELSRSLPADAELHPGMHQSVTIEKVVVRVVGIRCVHYIEQKDCTAGLRARGILEIP